MFWGYHDVLAALNAHAFAFVVVATGLQLLGRFIWDVFAKVAKKVDK